MVSYLHLNNQKRLPFVFIQSFYSFYWDVTMDWDLGYSHAFFLRPNLSFGKKYYVLAILLDLTIRCTWFLKWYYEDEPFAVILDGEVVSFVFQFLEVCRRGMWMIFRLESIHCQQKGNFKRFRLQ